MFIINLDVLTIYPTSNLNFFIPQIINENNNELCVGVETTSIQGELQVISENFNNTILFSTTEDSDFWAFKQKYTIHKAYKNYLSYENSRNRFYNRTFNQSFDDSI